MNAIFSMVAWLLFSYATIQGIAVGCKVFWYGMPVLDWIDCLTFFSIAFSLYVWHTLLTPTDYSVNITIKK